MAPASKPKSSVGELRIEDLLKNLDVDGDGDIDEEDRKLGETLKSMDKDGDGTITLRELVNIGQSKLQDEKKIKNLKRVVVLVVFAALAFCGVMLGLMVAANEASKETETSSSGVSYVKGSNTPMGTAGLKSQSTIFAVVDMDGEQLESINYLKFDNAYGIFQYTVTGVYKKPNSFVRFVSNGATITVSKDSLTVEDEINGVKFTETVAETKRRRALLSEDCPMCHGGMSMDMASYMPANTTDYDDVGTVSTFDELDDSDDR